MRTVAGYRRFAGAMIAVGVCAVLAGSVDGAPRRFGNFGVRSALLGGRSLVRCTRVVGVQCGPVFPGGQRLGKVRVGPPRWPAAVTPAAIRDRCPGQALGAVCGHVEVPLDRAHPKRGKIAVFFELFGSINPGPPESAILVNFGGPGPATTDPGSTLFALHLFAGALDRHDLLLVDDRGRGLSGTINCPELQHGTAPFAKAEADCAAQLGRGDTLYGTGDVAQDNEAVRAALGFDKVDYYGLSYGGADVTAYATRFGAHLRSIVLDSPFGAVLDNFSDTRYRVKAEPRLVRLDCVRSPTCAADHSDPVGELERLVRRIQASPVEGDAYDANGQPVHVRIDETALLSDLIDNPTGNFLNTGELLAAGASLQHGDPRPLLRLGAEQQLSLTADFGDPTVYSGGAGQATFCVDNNFAWSWSAPVAQREAQYQAAVAALPPNYFAPFSNPVATSNLFQAGLCLWWERPRRSSPIVAPQAVYPDAPVLTLSGDMDNRVPSEETAMLTARFPNHTFVKVAGAGHASVFWSQCAANLASQFIETLHVGDTRCARTPDTVFPAVGRFPVLAADARPAAEDPNGGNLIGLADRKAVTVAVASATDALQRSIIGKGSGVGLRGGTFHTTYRFAKWTTTLTHARFATDVSVDGTATWSAERTLVADLHLSGAGTGGGTIHVTGRWQAPGPAGEFRVSGTLGGLNVAVLVPEQ